MQLFIAFPRASLHGESKNTTKTFSPKKNTELKPKPKQQATART
jgi:hypothetical protein